MSSRLKPIQEIAEKLAIGEQYLEPLGAHMAKLRLELLSEPRPATQGKLILVTAMTSTSSGEGKTVTSIGLAQALTKIGKKAIVTLREPSLGPVFGLKGGANDKFTILSPELTGVTVSDDGLPPAGYDPVESGPYLGQVTYPGFCTWIT